VTRTAYQRVYDMILSYGQEEYLDNKKRLTRFTFFKDEQHGGQDAIFGLDISLMRLVSVFKSAAETLRHRAPGDPVARPGGQFQVHHCASAQARPGGLFARARGRPVHLRVTLRPAWKPIAGGRAPSAARCTRAAAT